MFKRRPSEGGAGDLLHLVVLVNSYAALVAFVLAWVTAAPLHATIIGFGLGTVVGVVASGVVWAARRSYGLLYSVLGVVLVMIVFAFLGLQSQSTGM